MKIQSYLHKKKYKEGLTMKKWTTQSGEEISVEDMDMSHIEKCIRYLQKKIDIGDTTQVIGDVSGDAEDRWADEIDTTPVLEEWIEIFRKELSQRQTT